MLSDEILNFFIFMLLSEPVNFVLNLRLLFMWLNCGISGANSFIDSLLLCSSPEKNGLLFVAFSGNFISMPFELILLFLVAMYRRFMCALCRLAFISAFSRFIASPDFSSKAIFLM